MANYDVEDFPFCEWYDDGPESADELDRDQKIDDRSMVDESLIEEKLPDPKHDRERANKTYIKKQDPRIK
jgi:hypothetical protein